MRAIVVGNCQTRVYAEVIMQLFPDWEVRLVKLGNAAKWLADGTKPEFTDYLASCDLFVGHGHRGPPISDLLNPMAEKVWIPGIGFRGLHPDIAILPGFAGLCSSSQVSLIAVAARALGLGVDQTLRLYNEKIYTELGYFDLYEREKNKLLGLFNGAAIDLSADFPAWEARGNYIWSPNHPRAFVLIDVVRRALLGRYIDDGVHAASAGLAETMIDRFAMAETWPVYPEIAARHGFAGSLVWRNLVGHAELSLETYLSLTFQTLDAMEQDWRQVAFVERVAAVLQPLV